jgi:hypothetical protein
MTDGKYFPPVRIIYCVGFLGFCFAIGACEKPQQPAVEKQEPPPQLQSRAKATIYFDLQERCAKQAREQFKQLGWDKQEVAGFTNHYNEKMNKCFMLIQSTDAKSSPGTIWTNSVLLDAFEGKELGTYSWHTVKDKKYWEVPPFQCEVTLPSGEIKPCNSEVEFNELIKIYME